MSMTRRIAILGLGYLGLEVAVALGASYPVIAFDISSKRIKQLQEGYDMNNEVPSQLIQSPHIHYTTEPQHLREADFYIIAVPTPIDASKSPDFSMLIQAVETVGHYLKKEDIVVIESSIYPGATEEICIPLLEKTAKLKFNKDFFMGYSPGRINPCDKRNTFKKIVKIVSASNKATLEVMKSIYNGILDNKVYSLSSIRAAEAAKMIENIQRDVNIAFMNEIAMMLHSLNLDTHEVLDAIKTKWNALDFEPGLVGGHCIGVNPYYFLFKAKQNGFQANIIHTSRKTNEFIPKFIAQETLKQAKQIKKSLGELRLAILGITYKENCHDCRDSEVISILNHLKPKIKNILIHDSIASVDTARENYQFNLCHWDELKNIDVMIIAVAHNDYRALQKSEILSIMNDPGIIVDIKSILNKNEFDDTGIKIWRL